MIRMRVTGVQAVLKGLEDAREEIREAVVKSIAESAERVKVECQGQLEVKGLDPEGSLARSLETSVTEGKDRVVAAVTTADPTAYDKELSESGGFMFVSSENTKGDVLQTVAAGIRRVVK